LSVGVGAADGGPLVFGFAVVEEIPASGTLTTGVGVADVRPIVFGSAVFEGFAAPVHPARTASSTPTTATHKACLRRYGHGEPSVTSAETRPA
jgi:hypothetical protein